MAIRKLRIQNFKRFRRFEIDFAAGMNILVGDNNAGKSTILEAIHVATTGTLYGRPLAHELSQHLFNKDAVAEYLASLKGPAPVEPPEIVIEVHVDEVDGSECKGNGNQGHVDAVGFSLRIAFDEDYKHEYEHLVKERNLGSLPIEFYKATWQTFARSSVTTRSLPIRSALIDSSMVRHNGKADSYVSRLVRDLLEPSETVGLAQAYREMKESFNSASAVTTVNEKLQRTGASLTKNLKLSAELPTRNDWEDSLMTCIEDVPFPHIGRGHQSIIKTHLALQHKKAKKAPVVLIEEPENNLAHTNLNSLLGHIKEYAPDRQIIVSTHSSFVANKLGLDSLVLLGEGGVVRLSNLPPDTKEFFDKVAGYDTLRLILAQCAILVEGDSDELIVQKAYMQSHAGRLPIEDGIDVISVGTAFLRFLEIADRVRKPVRVVTDSDGAPNAVRTKYAAYLGTTPHPCIRICFDDEVDAGELRIGDKPFNYNTLEPKLLKVVGLETMNRILGTSLETTDAMHRYMRANKTECALRVFQSSEQISFPRYIMEAVSW
jgi:putative ATP-dependent endonuclease of OLD family